MLPLFPPPTASAAASAAAAGGGGWSLLQAKAALPKYRELLRSTRRGEPEESSSLFQQAKERVLLRVQERRQAARVDPHRAFARLRSRLTDARLSLRALKDEQRERLRQYVAAAVGSSSSSSSSSSSVSSSSSAAAAGVAERPLAPRSAAVLAQPAGLAAAEARAAAALGTDGVLRHLVVAGVGGACRLFLSAGARTSVEGQERMAAAVARAPGRGLITVCNHVGSIDDPLITSAVLPASALLDVRSVRWTLCATDRCFKSSLLAPFFRAAKVLPVERGAGLSQFGMQLAQSRLAAGEWVHIFPEGTRSRDGRMLPVRRGVGWLVAASAATGGPPPLVLPFVHSGMEGILPKGASLPKLGQELRVLVGEPVPVEDLLAEAAQGGWSEQRLQVAIAGRVGQALYALKAQLEGLPLEAVAPRAAVSATDDTLLPLIEDEMDSLAHRWHDRWQRLSLPSLTQRVRATVAARRAALADSALLGGGASGGSFDAIAAATEDAAGVISSWEHSAVAAGDASPGMWEASAPTSAPARPAEQADAAAAAAPLARLKLRLLRGGMLQAAARSSGASGSSASGGAAPAGAGRLDFAAASPLDAVAALSAGGASGTLPGLLALAASYSAQRAQHMRRLLASPSSTSAAGSLSAA